VFSLEQGKAANEEIPKQKEPQKARSTTATTLRDQRLSVHSCFWA